MLKSILLYYIYPQWWTYEYLVRKKKIGQGFDPWCICKFRQTFIRSLFNITKLDNWHSDVRQWCLE